MEDEVISECSFSLYLHGVLLAVLDTVPRDLSALALGYLLTQGMIRSTAEIDSITLDESALRADITLVTPPAQGGALLVTDGGDRTPVPFQLPSPRRQVNPMDICAQELLEGATDFLSPSELHSRTGSSHAAQIMYRGEVVARCEDIGRFNAIDKAIGSAARQGCDLSRSILFVSGRIPVSICQKAIRAGIPALVGRAGPTDKAVELARESGLTVIGFVRDGHMNLYAGALDRPDVEPNAT